MGKGRRRASDGISVNSVQAHASTPTTASSLVVASSRSASLSRQATLPQAGLVVIGAHGGAGATTIARLLDPDRAGYAIEDHEVEGAYPTDRRPVLVARSTASGISAAACILASWHPRVPPPALVMVADAPVGDPPAVKYRIRALVDQVAGIVRMPYIYSLRAYDDALDALGLPRVAKVAAGLRRQLAQVL